MEKNNRIMGKKTDKTEVSGTLNGKNDRSNKELNDLQDKVENQAESNVSKSNIVGSSSFTINVGLHQCSHEKSYNIDGDVTLAEASGSSSHLKRRAKSLSFCPPKAPSPDSQPSSSEKKIKVNKQSKLKNKSTEASKEVDQLPKSSNITNQKSEDNSDNDDNDACCGAIALEKMKFDFKIDPNVVDRYTDSGFTKEGSTPESPETRRQRIDIISRQCRLHPANKKYNQGPVENPPPITPGKMVGYTPGGQRHEVDLNFDRPTWFNSEYARMQWDCATRVNVSRMFHELETGMFLPNSLDPNIERKYLATEDVATQQATEHFEEVAKASSRKATSQSSAAGLTEKEEEHLRLLEIEKELLELNKYPVVRLPDFAGEVVQKLRKALDLTITPLMIKKNPAIVDTLETLTTHCKHIEVVLAARALLDKIKGLFQVPESKKFREFFAAEVKKLKENTKDMSCFDILMMTEELPDESDGSSSLVVALPSIQTEGEQSLAVVLPSNQTEGEESLAVALPSSQTEGEQSLAVALPSPSTPSEDSTDESEEEWIPIMPGEVWIDSNQDTNDNSTINEYDTNDDDSFSIRSDLSSLISDYDEDDDDDTRTTNDESEDSVELSYPDIELPDELDDMIETLISEE